MPLTVISKHVVPTSYNIVLRDIKVRTKYTNIIIRLPIKSYVIKFLVLLKYHVT